MPALLETTSPTRDTPGTPGHCTITTPPERRLFPSFSTLRESREGRRDSKSGSETLPTLETARFDDAAAGTSLHAMTEAVTALSPSNLGLISPLHDKKRELESECRQVTKPRGTMSKFGMGFARRARCPDAERSANKWHGSRKESEALEQALRRFAAWQSLEKAYPTWVFLVERIDRTHPHRRIPRSCGPVLEGRYSPALTLGA